jgi:hypothetical protein
MLGHQVYVCMAYGCMFIPLHLPIAHRANKTAGEEGVFYSNFHVKQMRTLRRSGIVHTSNLRTFLGQWS